MTGHHPYTPDPDHTSRSGNSAHKQVIPKIEDETWIEWVIDVVEPRDSTEARMMAIMERLIIDYLDRGFEVVVCVNGKIF